jgi:CrcB protein
MDILKAMMIVGAGSCFGGMMRYLVSMWLKGVATNGMPWGILIVNLLGCLLFGLIYGVFSRHGASASHWSLLLTTGLCGGFTTFSTFSKEALLMLQAENYWALVAYVGISVVAGIVLAAVGYVLSRTM